MKALYPLLFAFACVFSSAARATDPLESQVSIYRDDYGTPHIVGDTEEAASFGYGYAQAEDHLEDTVLALLFLTIHDDQGRAWRGHGWDSLGRLHEKGMILNPVGKAKPVVLTAEGVKRSEELFRKHFGAPD